jgi:AraC-like DNA-binding protein
MRYVECEPLPALAPFLERVWTLEGHAEMLAGEPQVVLPDGRTELIFHFGDPFERIDSSRNGNTTTLQPRLLFAGQLTSQLVLQPTGRIGVLGLRFHPFGAAGLFSCPQDQLAGTTAALEALSIPAAQELGAIFGTTSTLAEAAVLAQHALVSLIDHRRIDSRVADAVREIEASHGLASIDRVAMRVGMTRRHMERQFRQIVGMTPKRLARIARFQRAVRFLEGDGDAGRPGGAITAAACGYADQAHFIRDFRNLAGRAPTEHLLNKGVLTGFFTR